MGFVDCNIDESKIVCTVCENGAVWSKPVLGDIFIAVKVPGSAPSTFYKRKLTPHHYVIFTGVYAKLDKDGWILGLPEGFSSYDCKGDDDKWYAIITMP